ncbi:MAG: TldD/PmbA family protein [Candidatus Cloacimonetes bacterium]|nr:TldD/PmbA family protein [Candidatus Cloacimonadota bacterium]
MKEIIQKIIEKLNEPGITFADVRYTSSDYQSIFFEKGHLKYLSTEKNDEGIGIRVLMNGCWGFAGTTLINETEIDKMIKMAISNALQGSLFRHQKVIYMPIKPTTGSYHFNPVENPFLMSEEEKIHYFENLAKLLTHNDKIVYSYINCDFFKQYKIYANTEGTFTDSTIYDVMPKMYVLASDGLKNYSRTWPGDMNARRGGFEKVRDFKFEENSERVIKEAIDLLSAPSIEEERADIIIGGGHLALQIHESVGHATEADRMFGMEISYAGKTFVKQPMLKKFRYGSEIVTIYSDSTLENGLGYHLVDDEGVPGRRVDIIKNGILNDMQTAREIAPLLELEPSSNMKASYANDFPLVRMTNLCLEPGKGSLQELIKETEKGYFIDFTKTWSIDDNRNNFQFTTEIGYKIVEGKIVGIVKEPTYFGITPEFWASCDKICGIEEWEMYGTFHCGKGEPGQVMHLSHGASPARFRNVVCNVKA